MPACGGLWREAVAPYKKISDQICSILPWLPEAGVARVPLALVSILPWLPEAGVARVPR